MTIEDVIGILLAAMAIAIVAVSAGWYLYASRSTSRHTSRPTRASDGVAGVHQTKNCCVPVMDSAEVHAIEFEFSKPMPLEDIEWAVVNYTGVLKQYVHSVGGDLGAGGVVTYEVFVCKDCLLHGGAATQTTPYCGKLIIAPVGAAGRPVVDSATEKITFVSGCTVGYGLSEK